MHGLFFGFILSHLNNEMLFQVRSAGEKKKVMLFLAGINEPKARKMLASLLMEPTSSQTTIIWLSGNDVVFFLKIKMTWSLIKQKEYTLICKLFLGLHCTRRVLLYRTLKQKRHTKVQVGNVVC
jgi:hypothetical protein